MTAALSIGSSARAIARTSPRAIGPRVRIAMSSVQTSVSQNTPTPTTSVAAMNSGMASLRACAATSAVTSREP